MPTWVEGYRSPAFSEEGLQDGGAVGGENPGSDFDLMVEPRVGEDFETGADCAAFGVVCPIDEAGHAGLDNGPGAHTAGFDCDIESGISKAIVAKTECSVSKSNNFCVGRGIAIADGAVVRTRNNFAIADEHSTDGDFAGGGGGARFNERFLHVVGHRFHVMREDNTR